MGDIEVSTRAVTSTEPLLSVTVSLWSSACDHLSHPHTLTCKSVTATRRHSTIHYFQLLEGSPCSGAGGTIHMHSHLTRTVPRSWDLPRCPRAPTPEEHSHGIAPAAHAEMAQGRCPRNASAWIVGPTWADLWRPWNASFHFGKVLSLYSSRMEGIWHLTTSHNNRAPLFSHSQMWMPSQDSLDQMKMFTV